MAGGDLKFVISAVDNASKALGKVGQETEKLGKGVAGLNAAARVISAGAIIAFGASSVKAFADAEKSQVKLEQAYRRFPALASVQISALREMNQALQEKTGADADSLAAAQATLAQFKLSGDQIKQLTPLLVDYAQVTGQDVTTAATSLGRAFMGNTRALKAIGIDFKATGDTAKDFSSIMAALEGQVGGAGEAFGQTTAGQLQILQQSFEDLQEEVGAQLVPALKALVGVAKPILGAFGSLPEPMKSFTVAVGAAAAGALLLGPRVLGMVSALKDLVPAASKAAEALTAQAGAAASAETATEGAAVATSTLSKAMAGIAAGIGVTVMLYEATKKLQEVTGSAAEGIEGYADAVRSNNEAAAEAAESSFSHAMALDNIGNKLLLLTPLFPVAIANMKNAADAQSLMNDEVAELNSAASGAASASGALAGATGDLADQTSSAEESMSNLRDMLDDLAGTQMDSEKAFMRVQDAIDKATEAANTNGRTVDMNTEAGRANRSALQGLASDALKAAEAYHVNGESADSIRIKTQGARDAFIAVAGQMGLSRDAAEKLADQYGLVPDKVATTVSASGLSDVNSGLSTTIDRANQLDGRTVVITVRTKSGGSRNLRLPNPEDLGFAGGGFVTGQGTGTSDSIPAMLSNGEYVVRAAAVSRAGLSLLDDLNDDGVLNRRRYAAGGAVSANTKFLRFEASVERAIEQEQILKDLIDERKRSATAMRGRQAGFASLSNSFDVGAFAGAQKDVVEARRRLNMAATPQEAAAARADLAAAERSAAASKPTAGNLIKGLRARMRQLTSFAADLKSLVAKKRIPTAILRDIIDAGPEEGGALAKSLLTAKTPELDELVRIQNKIDDAASFIGQTDANLEFNPAIRRQRGVVNRAVARATERRNEYLAVRTQVTIDGKQVAEALAEYKRAIGGRRLGLD